MTQIVRNQLAMQETQAQSLGWEDPRDRAQVSHIVGGFFTS